MNTSETIPNSLTVDSLPHERQPGKTTCAGCRHAVWYALDSSVHCNCMLRLTDCYASTAPHKLIKNCDGRRMNTDLTEFLETHGGELDHPSSTTVDALPSHRRPGKTMCSHCPSATWYEHPEGVHCDCRLMRAESYSSEHPSARIVLCDGILISTMRLLKRKQM